MDSCISIHDIGFVRLVDTMGDDMAVVRAARVSYGEESKGDDADQKLINFMMSHNHGTPFEHINFTFHIKCPIFVARQWFRHRIGSFNEISLRYTEYEEQIWRPDAWRMNNQINKQSSGEGNFSEKEIECLNGEYDNAMDAAVITYNGLLERGVAREQARAVLPMAAYTEFYWTVNARSLFNFLKLRMADSAQKEIQDYAIAVYELAQPVAPWAFKAWESL